MHVSPSSGPGWVWLLCLCALGCAGHAGHVQPPASQPEPAAEAYASRVPPGPGPGDGAVAQAVVAVAREASLVHDPRLSRVAAQLITPGPLQAPPVALLDAAIRAEGLVEPVPVLRAAAGTEAGVAQMLADQMRETLASRRRTHFGLAVDVGPRGAAAVLLLSERQLELQPLPRSAAAGASLRLKGELAAGYQAPAWVVTPPRGDVRRFPPGEGAAFDLELPLDDAGEYRIELLAEGPEGVTVVANFPVWSGQAPPPVETTGRPPGSAAVGDPATIEAELRELIRQERSRAGRAPLQRLPAVDAVARAHTLDMAQHDFVAHQSPRTGGPADRIRAAGLSAWLVRENLGRGYSAEEIHEGLMRSPGHRENLLSQDAESLGLAVVAVQEGARAAFLATELFVSLAHPVNVTRARQDVIDHIHQARRASGLRAVAVDSQLAQAAQTAAERYMRGGIDKQAVLAGVLGGAGALPEGEQVGASMAVLYGMGQLRDHDLGLDVRARAIGVGLAQGQRSDTPPHALAVVVLFSL